ncbi:MAG TPA: helix-turn-helix domain-containing protein, partial [bacterium]|nr:helix-turn-helix domain-containing protein [bacterium]
QFGCTTRAKGASERASKVQRSYGSPPPASQRRRVCRAASSQATGRHFAGYFALQTRKKLHRIEDDFIQALKKHTWPGNIRELKNIIHRMMVFAEGSHLEMGDIPDELLKVKRSAVVPVLPEGSTVFGVSALLPIEDMEREYIRFVLHQTGENKAEASKLLGMKRTTLVMRMKKLGLLA